MFTGLVETVGSVVELTPGPRSTRIGVRSSLDVGGMQDGESVAVDGVCLTVVRREGDRFEADVIAETLGCTTLGGLDPGSEVNLERSLRLGDRLGGHLVQGHVDTTLAVLERVERGDDYRLRIGLAPAIRPYVAFKGSVALAGVSLTVAAVDDEAFEVALIPQTRAATTLGRIGPGDRLNVEVDLLARYLDRLNRFGCLDSPGQAGRDGRDDAR